MKRKILPITITLIVLAALVFPFVFDTSEPRDYLKEYKEELNAEAVKMEKVLSTNPEEAGLRITFFGCKLNPERKKRIQPYSKLLAQEVNENYNQDGAFENIILVYKMDTAQVLEVESLEARWTEVTISVAVSDLY